MRQYLRTAPVLGEKKLFVEDSLSIIKAQHFDRPFMLVFWSMSSLPSMSQLRIIGEVGEFLPDNSVVLVSADSEADDAEIQTVLQRFGLERFDTWRLADGFADQPCHTLDPEWSGELPRAYFYNANHDHVPLRGALGKDVLEQWLLKLAGVH